VCFFFFHFKISYIVVTILPPLLPTVFTVAVGVSEDRLTKKRITTVNPESILIAGKVKIAFFDKTGTLTKPGMDFHGTRSAVTWQHTASSSKISDELKIAMATCHSLTMTQDGRVVGTPMDRTMFSVSSGKMEANGSIITTETGEQFTVVRHFDFDHHRMSQSVVLMCSDGTYVAFVKGSGESFDSVLHESSKNGIYQITVASKVITSESLDSLRRDDVESNLNFVGVINFKNVIREDTPGVIDELTNGDVRSIIVTGDSVLAGIRVAKESGIMSLHKPVVIAGTSSSTGELTWTDYNGNPVDIPLLTEGIAQQPDRSFDLAISGRAWEVLLLEHPKAVIALAPFVGVFGRLTLHDKISVIKTYVDLGFVTLMAGDGGNDVGALKAAHVGVALSGAEASMVAPFTSLDKTITSVVDVLKVGRCALASAITTYKFMIIYGQVETIIQLIAAYFQITPAEFCWVYTLAYGALAVFSLWCHFHLFFIFRFQDDHDCLYVASISSRCRVGEVSPDNFNS
jgi:magnesium-transporting ATPase (P-type)